jgi:hypothetical protein
MSDAIHGYHSSHIEIDRAAADNAGAAGGAMVGVQWEWQQPI